MTPEASGQQDLRNFIRILWRWKFLFLFILVVVPVAAYLIERGKPKTYQSSTLLAIQGSTINGVSVEPQNVAAVARLATTTPVAQKAALYLGVPSSSAGALLNEVSTTSDTTTGFVGLTVVDRSPYRAAAVARAFAHALGGVESQQSVQGLDAQIKALNRQLQNTPANDSASRSSITSQITQLREQRTTSSTGVQIIQPALVSHTPVGPQTRRSVEIALVIALLLAIGAIFIAENSDRRLRNPEDLEDLTKMPLLGTVPTSAFKPDPVGEHRDVEAFQMLRAALTYFNVDRPLSSVAIISPLVADGKTTVAVGLAIAAARAGKRAILVDADLRRPQVCTRLGIEPTPGLSAVLAGEKTLSEVMLEYPVPAPHGGQLLVLPANLGPLPPNPSALLSSQEMKDLLGALERQSDLVIVDTAAALAVSDALPLLQMSSGIMMIVRMNRSSRAAVRRLQKVIAASHGRVLGVVATGVTSAVQGYDKYGYYAQGERAGGSRRARLRRKEQPRTTVPLAADNASNGAGSPEFERAAGPTARSENQG